MPMIVETMRTAIMKVYPGRTWKKKIQAMEDDQVIAIYSRMKRDGIFEKTAEARKKKEIAAMKYAITEVYPGPTWRIKVQTMKDDQVIAIYSRMKRDGIFEKAKKARKKKEKMKEQGIQMTIWDFMMNDDTEDESK